MQTIPNFKKPYFQVNFNASICNFEVYINDMPAFVHHEGGSIYSQVPINHLICKSGEQDIRIRILPLKKETLLKPDGRVKIKIEVYDSGLPDQISQVLNYETPDLSKNQFPMIEHTGKFEAKVPYTLAGWYSSIDLNQKEALLTAAKQFYEKIYTLIKEDRQAGFIQLQSIKMNEIDQAFYISGADNASEWNDVIGRVKDAEMVLQDFPPTLRSTLYGNGKVLNLVRPDGQPVLYFKNDQNEEFSFPLFIHKRTGAADFEIIR